MIEKFKIESGAILCFQIKNIGLCLLSIRNFENDQFFYNIWQTGTNTCNLKTGSKKKFNYKSNSDSFYFSWLQYSMTYKWFYAS